MKLYIDLDLLALVSSATDRRLMTSVACKRGDHLPLEVRFVRAGVPVRLPASTVLSFGAKPRGEYDGALVVSAADFVQSDIPEAPAEDTDPHWTGAPSLNTAELNDLFFIDADPENDPESVTLMAEFSWLDDYSDGPASTATFSLVIANDVVRGDEGSPTAAANYGPGTVVAAVAATGATTMTGTNNDWDMTAVTKGTIGNSYSLRVVVDATKYTLPTVAIVSGAVTITAGAKARMYFDGMTTAGGGQNVTGLGFMLNAGAELNGKASFSSGANSCAWNGTKWVLSLYSTASFESAENVDSPSDVTTWVPLGSAVGPPTVTAFAHTSAQCKTAFDATTADTTLFTLANKAGNDGSGAVVAHGPVTLSGGINGTPAPAGLQLFDSNFLYIASTPCTISDSSGWRKIAFSAL